MERKGDREEKTRVRRKERGEEGDGWLGGGVVVGWEGRSEGEDMREVRGGFLGFESDDGGGGGKGGGGLDA